MRQRVVRGLVWIALTLTGATVYQVAFTGADNATQSCTRLATEAAITPIDFCYILDCQSGFLGGAIQPCGDPATTADDILVDCPGAATTGSTTAKRAR